MLTVKLEELCLEAGSRVLDLGCGEGRHFHALSLKPGVRVVGLDLGLPEVINTRRGMEELLSGVAPEQAPLQPPAVLVGDACTLPFGDNSFDAVICSEVLEHIPDYEAVLGEVRRILKPGGRLAVSVPRYLPERICWALSDEYHANEGGHIRIFNANALCDRVESFGMSVFNSHWAHALHSPYWWLQCALWDRRENSWLVQNYRRLLEWDIVSRPRITRVIENLLNPFIGKSVVFYFEKQGSAT